MRLAIGLVTLSFLFGLTAHAEAARFGSKTKKLIHGTVVSVQNDGDKGGTIIVRLHHKKNRNDAAPPVEKTVQISTSTKFELVQGRKGAVETKPAEFNSVQKGERVLVFLDSGVATDVKIVKKGKAKKKTV
jgi:hypothetical protein